MNYKWRIRYLISVSGAPGLVDKVFAVHAGSRGLTPSSGTCPNDFSNPIDQYIRTKCALRGKWRSVIAVSLNVGSGIRLIKQAKEYMCRQTHYKHNEDGLTAPGVCGRDSIPLSHSGLTGINLISKTIAPPIYKLYQIAMVILCRWFPNVPL